MKKLLIAVLGPILIAASILLFFNSPILTEGSYYKLGYTFIGLTAFFGIFLAARSFKNNENKWVHRLGLLTLIAVVLIFLFVGMIFMALSNLQD